MQINYQQSKFGGIRMRWRKKGLIYCPDGSIDWMNNSVLTPQPFLLNEEVIRIYASFRDTNGVGRIGYIDVEAKNPRHIIKISDKPVLDIGVPGTFNDNGLILGDVLRIKDEIYMYYVAFQLVDKIKFYAFSGLAISKDNGESFEHYSKVPVMDRSEEGIYGRCIHSVIWEENKFRIWYSVIYGWEYINNTPYPAYDIKYIESDDGIHIGVMGVQCLKCGEDEYRIGRPKVRHINGMYEMRYTSDSYSKEYKAGYAESVDGVNWVRKDSYLPLEASTEGWDSQMACYPVVLETKYGVYMFYDGNGMGKSGFGYAELLE